MSEQPIRVLLVDDDEGERVLISELFRDITVSRYQVAWSGDYDEALSLMSERRHDVYLIDYHLGARDGLELLREARAAGARAPAIFLTGLGYYAVDVEVMKAGAADYLVKGEFGPEMLERSVRYALERARGEAAVIQNEKLSAMGQLAAGVAHELNNPLNLILGIAEELEESARSAAKKEQATLLRRSADRCRTLVRELLTFARKEETLEDFALDACVEKALALVRPRARLQSVAIDPDLRSGLVVRGTPGALEQVLVNLANNALDAMPRGGTLTLSTRAVQGPAGPSAELLVSDTGPGVPPELRPMIFDPFFTTKPAGAGTGLGLSIVAKIVAKHGGKVELESGARGRGATFVVALPARAPAAALSHGTQDTAR